jgi:hypothetical protein
MGCARERERERERKRNMEGNKVVGENSLEKISFYKPQSK